MLGTFEGQGDFRWHAGTIRPIWNIAAHRCTLTGFHVRHQRVPRYIRDADFEATEAACPAVRIDSCKLASINRGARR